MKKEGHSVTVSTPEDYLANLITKAVSAGLKEVIGNIQAASPRRKLLTPKDIQEEFGVHARVLQYWRTMGIGPAYTSAGKRVYYERPVFEAFLAAGRVQTTGWVEE